MRLTEVLKKALRESGISHSALERATGVNRLTIARFLRGDNSLRSDKADDLAAFLGIECEWKGTRHGLSSPKDVHKGVARKRGTGKAEKRNRRAMG